MTAPIIGFCQSKTTDTVRAGKTITIISADRYNFQDIDTGSRFVSLAGHAIVQQENTIFSADSIVLNQKQNTLEALGNIHINDADSIHTYSQYLRYVGKEKKAYLSKQVKLTDGKGVLTTNDLVYDVQLKTGIYNNGGKLVNGKTILTSKEGYYYGETKDVYFKKKVVLVDPDFKLYTDTLLYNLNTSVSTFIVPTKIINGKRTIKTTDGVYDTKNKRGVFNKRTFIEDSTYTFAADSINLDDISGLSEYSGNAIYRSKDTIGGYDLLAGHIQINKPKGAFLATLNPLLIIKQKSDSVYVNADTLVSGKVTELLKTRNIPVVREVIVTSTKTKGIKQIKGGNDSTIVDEKLKDSSIVVKAKLDSAIRKPIVDTNNNRYFEAYNHVKIVTDSMQAIADSMFYSQQDSVFRLFKTPIVWSQDNQITGDTMLMFVSNKKPERLYVYENALTIQKVGVNYYNQVKGNSINAYFVKGQMDHLRAKGNAETIYYGLDDRKKFVAVNKANCDVIDMYFEKTKDESKPQKIVMRNNLTGTAFPMGQVNHDDMRLRGFHWLIDLKPTKEGIGKETIGKEDKIKKEELKGKEGISKEEKNDKKELKGKAEKNKKDVK